MLNFRWITCLLYFAAWMLVKTPSLSPPLELVQCTLFSLSPEQDYVFPFYLETCCNSAYIKTKHTSYPFLDKTCVFLGKTLSLLCSTLAWLERTRADQQLKALMPAADAGPVTEWSPPVRHKIIYSSRLSFFYNIFSMLSFLS